MSIEPISIGKNFVEFAEQDRLAERLQSLARIETAASISYRNQRYPVLTFALGSTDPSAPVLGFFGGVHGIERIGTQVVLAFMQSIVERVTWDETLQWQLQRMRLLFMPLINPVGMDLHRRGNGNGVDLMRNSPTLAEKGQASFLVGGQNFSRHFPWYRGNPSEMEAESQAVCNFVKRETFGSRASILIDVHSGFGVRDQLWFPYAKSKKPFPAVAEVWQIKDTLDKTFQNHVYLFEPQAKNYTTHGDLWDYLFDLHTIESSSGTMIPITLEMGSWSWVKKNPLQLFSYLGAFNPVKLHRKRRILRRHIPLFEYLMRMAISPQSWLIRDAADRAKIEQQALAHWY